MAVASIFHSAIFELVGHWRNFYNGQIIQKYSKSLSEQWLDNCIILPLRPDTNTDLKCMRSHNDKKQLKENHFFSIVRLHTATCECECIRRSFMYDLRRNCIPTIITVAIANNGSAHAIQSINTHTLHFNNKCARTNCMHQSSILLFPSSIHNWRPISNFYFLQNNLMILIKKKNKCERNFLTNCLCDALFIRPIFNL